MELKLEELSYQCEAIDAVVRLFEAQARNTFDMACREGVRSNIERNFAGSADNDDEVVRFLRLPAFCQIPTPIGPCHPDFGVVLRRKRLRDGKEGEFYFVVEKKGTNELMDKKALRESEVYKIKCAMKHFDAPGVDAHVNYNAPVKEYPVFKDRAKGVMHA